MSAWLHKQKKADVAELAEQAGLKFDDKAKKDDIIEALDTRLRTQQSTYASKPAFKEFYSHAGHRANSPVKREPKESGSSTAKDTADASAPAKAATKQRRKTGGSASSDASGILPRGTPRSIQRVAAGIPLPSSPQAVSNLVERQTAQFANRASQFLSRSGLGARADAFRAAVSSPQGVIAFVLLLEFFALQWKVITFRHAFYLPLPTLFKYGPHYDIKFPDFFVLLTDKYWIPTLLWANATVFAPLALGWLFNLTRSSGVSRRHAVQVDPVAFSVAKMLVAWVVFERHWYVNGLVNKAAANTVTSAIYGGTPAMIVGGAVGVLAGIYDSVLRK